MRGADEVMSYGGVTTDNVRDLVHGAIFTRGPKDLHHTAIFIGGTDMAAGERLLGAVQKAFFGPIRVSVMLDSNGSNTTAVAAVAKMRQAAGTLDGTCAPSSQPAPAPSVLRAAGLLAKAGARVTVTSRRAADGALAERSRSALAARFAKSRWRTPPVPRTRSKAPRCSSMPDPQVSVWFHAQRGSVVPASSVAGDVNAVPPLGVEGIEVTDDGATREA